MTAQSPEDAREGVRRTQHAITAREHDHIVTALRQTTASITYIANTHGLSVDTIRKIADANGINWRSRA
jgi:hypothetical protein